MFELEDGGKTLRSMLTVGKGKNKEMVGDMTVDVASKQVGHSQIYGEFTNKKHRGFLGTGLSNKMYGETLKHLGALKPGYSLSPGAQSVWKKMYKNYEKTPTKDVSTLGAGGILNRGNTKMMTMHGVVANPKSLKP